MCDPCLRGIQRTTNNNANQINAINTALQGIDLSLLETINRKLGPEVSGGLSGWLKRFSNSLRLDRVMNILNTLLLLHNAAQLSQSLGDSLSYLAESSLQLIGIKDEEGTPIDINSTIGDFLSSTAKLIVGEDVYDNLSEGWKKTSKIYTAAINVYELALSSLAGLAEGLEIMGNYTGKIGNALKRSGTILENSYQWLDENVRIKTGRIGAIGRVLDGIESTEDVVSSLTEVTENIAETSENIESIKGEITDIRETVEQNEEDKKTEEYEAKTASQSPSLEPNDLIKPED